MSKFPTDRMFFHMNKKDLIRLNPGAGRVLVVDDDPISALVAKQMLETLDFRIDSVNCGAAAKIRLAESRYDLLISDLQMPEIDGYALSSWLKETSTETKVIIMTGLGPADVAGYMSTDLIDGWLFKPFSLSELSSAVSRCFSPAAADISGYSEAGSRSRDVRVGLQADRDIAES